MAVCRLVSQTQQINMSSTWHRYQIKSFTETFIFSLIIILGLGLLIDLSLFWKLLHEHHISIWQHYSFRLLPFMIFATPITFLFSLYFNYRNLRQNHELELAQIHCFNFWAFAKGLIFLVILFVTGWLFCREKLLIWQWQNITPPAYTREKPLVLQTSTHFFSFELSANPPWKCKNVKVIDRLNKTLFSLKELQWDGKTWVMNRQLPTEKKDSVWPVIQNSLPAPIHLLEMAGDLQIYSWLEILNSDLGFVSKLKVSLRRVILPLVFILVCIFFMQRTFRLPVHLLERSALYQLILFTAALLTCFSVR